MCLCEGGGGGGVSPLPPSKRFPGMGEVYTHKVAGVPHLVLGW